MHRNILKRIIVVYFALLFNLNVINNVKNVMDNLEKDMIPQSFTVCSNIYIFGQSVESEVQSSNDFYSIFHILHCTKSGQIIIFFEACSLLVFC